MIPTHNRCKDSNMTVTNKPIKGYQSKYYPFAPLHNEHKRLNIMGRYKDSVDALFGKYLDNGKPQQFGIVDYLTLGILPALEHLTHWCLFKTLKKGLALLLAIPLTVIVIVFLPLLELIFILLNLVA